MSLIIFYTSYRFYFPRKPFLLTENPDPHSPAKSLGPITFAVFSWVLYLFTLQVLFGVIFRNSPQTSIDPGLFSTTIEFLWTSISSGNVFLILFSLFPFLFLMIVVTYLHYAVSAFIGSNRSFDVCISISGYLVGAYAIFGTIFCISISPYMATEAKSWLALPIGIFFGAVWGYFLRWRQFLIEELLESEKYSVITILGFLPTIALIVWMSLKVISWSIES